MANPALRPKLLGLGKTADEVRAEWACPRPWCCTACSQANRPSNTLLARQLTPHTLGALAALYEHSVQCAA
jgi:glucose-6-phosphate isomerase